MSFCEHDVTCPGFGPDHDIAAKASLPRTAEFGWWPSTLGNESNQGRKRKQRAARKARADKIR